MKTIAMWFDGGGAHGFGNIRRSRELGARLAQRGHAVTWRPLSADAARLAGLAWPAANLPGEIVILDLPYPGDALLAEARAGGARTLGLDYLGTAAPDVVVSLQDSPLAPPHARQRIGFEYAIIRDEFRQVERRSEPGHTLVVLGGGDAGELTAQVVEKLLPLADRITVVEGPLGGSSLPADPRVRVVRQPSDLPGLMAACDWAVSTGGTTMLELLSLGKAVHVVPRTPAEQVFAQRLAAQQALLGIGCATLAAPTPADKARCAQRGPALVDGKGCERIAQVVEEFA